MSEDSALRFHDLLRELGVEYDLLFERIEDQSRLPTRPPSPPPILLPDELDDPIDDKLSKPPKEQIPEHTRAHSLVKPILDEPDDSLDDTLVLPPSDGKEEATTIVSIPGTLPQESDSDLKKFPSLPSLRTASSDINDMPTVCSPLTVTSATFTSAFEDPSKVKENVRRMSDAIELQNAPSRNLSKFLSNSLKPASFREDGCIAQVAKSKVFEMFTLTVVVLNGIWIAIDADLNPADFLFDADPIFIVVENLFCLVFTFELLLRWCAFRSKRSAFRDFWFIFDASLVIITIVETWVVPVVVLVANDGRNGKMVNASILRLLRLVRLSRLSRIVRIVPELSFMVKGVFEATRSVACTMGLLFGILFVFGIVLRRLSNDTIMGEKYFSSVPHAVFTLFAQGTLLDSVAILMIEVNREDTFCALLVLFVVMVGALTLMNMLVGVLCEVMNSVAHKEQERMAMNFVSEQIRIALLEIDTNLDKMISKEEFQHILLNQKAMQALRDIGVDVVAFVDFADYFFQSDKHGQAFDEKLSFEAFMEIVMQVRGVNSATVRDIIELRKFIHRETTNRNAMLRRLQENQKTLANNQRMLERCIMKSRARTKSSSTMQDFVSRVSASADAS